MPNNISIHPVSSARNLGIIFDSELSKHISSLSKSCFCLIRNLRKIRSSIDLPTATTIAVSLIHSKLDDCYSLFLNLPNTQLDKLQSTCILNSAARAITSTSKYSRITPILKSLYWLKIKERIHYQLLSLTLPSSSINLSIFERF